jgi:polysaccharide biosynthesis protein PslH
VRILFVAPRYPYPADRGDRRRVLHLLQGLAARADVTLVCFGSGPPLPFDGVRVDSVGRDPRHALRANAGAHDPRLPLQVRLYLDSSMRSRVQGWVNHWAPDVAHVTLARMAPYLPPAGTCHRHLDLVDALSLNMESRARASPAPARAVFSLEARLMRRYESDRAAAADSSSLVSTTDRAAAPGLAAAAVLPNGVDPDAFGYSDPATRPPRLLFFGNLGYFHNVEPARFVASDVVPRVREQVPEAVLRIAGARPAPAVRRLDRLAGVEVVGPVPDMARELHGAAVAVVPMFSGTGMKNKVIEAFCAGTPVVTNAAGAAGLPDAEPGRHYLRAEGAREIADACVRLLSAPAERCRLAVNARALVERRFTWDATVDALLALYDNRGHPALSAGGRSAGAST